MQSPRTITALSGAALAAGLGVAIKVEATNSIDRAVRRRIRPRRSPALRSLGKGISLLAGPRIHAFAATALGIVIRLKTGKGGTAPVAASLGAIAVDNCTRLFVRQRRPPGAGRHHGLYRYGYPSGHTTATTAIAVAAASDIAEQLSPTERRVLWAGVVAVSVAVGWSRLYLDEHWIDDVVGGWLAGVALGIGAASL